MISLNLEEDIRPLSEFRAELLRDLQTAARQIEDGLGVPQEEARKQALARLSD